MLRFGRMALLEESPLDDLLDSRAGERVANDARAPRPFPLVVDGRIPSEVFPDFGRILSENHLRITAGDQEKSSTNVVFVVA